jgi:hypothetical protein
MERLCPLSEPIAASLAPRLLLQPRELIAQPVHRPIGRLQTRVVRPGALLVQFDDVFEGAVDRVPGAVLRLGILLRDALRGALLGNSGALLRSRLQRPRQRPSSAAPAHSSRLLHAPVRHRAPRRRPPPETRRPPPERGAPRHGGHGASCAAASRPAASNRRCSARSLQLCAQSRRQEVQNLGRARGRGRGRRPPPGRKAPPPPPRRAGARRLRRAAQGRCGWSWVARVSCGMMPQP